MSAVPLTFSVGPVPHVQLQESTAGLWPKLGRKMTGRQSRVGHLTVGRVFREPGHLPRRWMIKRGKTLEP
jgi:hypothetical protein